MKIFGGRGGLIGDTIMCLPLIPTLESMYGEIDLTWPICKKCVQASPLYINQAGINSIYVTKDEEWLNDSERAWVENKFDLFINPTPSHPWQSDWYNYRTCVEETMLMAGVQYFETYKTLPDALKLPKLYPWWKQGKKPETIAIHTTAGYSRDKNRSPSFEWWDALCYDMSDLGFDVLQFGHWDDKFISNAIEDYRNASFFEQIQRASECEWYIGTDSGFSWIMGALGVKQISLLTNWLPNHHSNPLALAATNHAGLATNLFAPGGCDNIDINKVLELL